MANLLIDSCTGWNSQWVLDVSCIFRKYWMEICILYLGSFNDSKSDLYDDNSSEVYGHKKNRNAYQIALKAKRIFQIVEFKELNIFLNLGRH